jgi:hypothetical protein
MNLFSKKIQNKRFNVKPASLGKKIKIPNLTSGENKICKLNHKIPLIYTNLTLL